jgi:hypothetical protein
LRTSRPCMPTTRKELTLYTYKPPTEKEVQSRSREEEKKEKSLETRWTPLPHFIAKNDPVIHHRKKLQKWRRAGAIWTPQIIRLIGGNARALEGI